VFNDASAHLFVSHYTSFETLCQYILPTMRLRMSRFARLNDPRESRSWLLTLSVPDARMREPWDIVGISSRFSDYMKLNAKLLCVAQDDPQLQPARADYLYGRSYAHPSMWDRYADGHAGVCLLLDKAQLTRSIENAASGRGPVHHSAVSYNDMPGTESDAYILNADEISTKGEEQVFADHQRDYVDQLYFNKSKDWSVESEYRWVLLDGSADDVYVDIRRCLKAVIFGEALSADKASFVQGALERRRIALAAMRYRNGHPVVLPWA
jgi:hypothetical protein